MVLIIIASLLVLGIAFYQVLQGLFSALVMTFLTIISAAIAFNYYESLAEPLKSRMPGYADAISLLALFVLTLLILRIIYDMLIKGNVVFGLWADRIGGGLLGLVCGGIIVGVGAIIVQMLPFGPSVMTYKPFDNSLVRQSSLAPFYPDDYALGIVKGLSAGSLAGERTYEMGHDNLPLELFAIRNHANLYGRTDSEPGALSVKGAYKGSGEPWLSTAPVYPPLGSGVHQLLIVRTTVGEQARDEDDWFRLPATHFRLVTDEGESYYPVAYVNSSSGAPKLNAAAGEGENVNLADLAVVTKADLQALVLTATTQKEKRSDVTIDWVYRLPQDAKPQYMVFRNADAVAVPEPKEELPY